MSRLFVKRFYGKKRGEHNMRSDKLGGASLAVFFGVCFIAGCVTLGIMLVKITIPDWRTNLDFRKTTCQVLETRVVSFRQPRAASAEHEAGAVRYRPEIHVAYTAQGREYDEWIYDLARWTSEDRSRARAATDEFVVGQTYPVWFDPTDPRQAVIVQGHNWFAWLILALPLSFIALGGSGLVYTLVNWDKSAERRAMLAQRAARLDPFDDHPGKAEIYPNVPRQAHLTNSPGTILAYRLPTMAAGPGLWGWVIVSMIWNAIVAIMLVLAIRGHMGGRADWSLTAVVTPLFIVGLLLLVLAARRVRAAVSVGPTIVEIDAHPLVPGRACEVFVRQSAVRPPEWIEVWLVCEEEARYQQGTNLRTEVCRVFQERLCRREAREAPDGEPCEIRVACTLPPGAMHSFAAPHHRISWKLLVVGQAKGHARFERSTALSVYPAPVPQHVPA